MHTSIQPPGWPTPKGYSNGIVTTGERSLFVGGQIGWDTLGKFAIGDLPAQVQQALQNVEAVLSEAGARVEHVARMTWYITSKADYIRQQKEIGAAYRSVMGKHFPAMSVVEVTALMEDDALVEIEVTAVF